MLRDRDDASLREHLIATAARLMGERGSAGLSVRDIAREAKVADGALYNYFEDKDDLLAQALLAHVGAVMSQASGILPEPGTATVAENLAGFVEQGIAVLLRTVPAFAGLLSQPGALRRFHSFTGGDPAFHGRAAAGGTPAGGPAAGGGAPAAAGAAPAAGGPPAAVAAPAAAGAPGPGGTADGGEGNPPAVDRGLPQMLSSYLLAEQRLGRIAPGADVEAASSLLVGAIHGQVLPRVLLAGPGAPLSTPPGLGARLAQVILDGLAPEAG